MLTKDDYLNEVAARIGDTLGVTVVGSDIVLSDPDIGLGKSPTITVGVRPASASGPFYGSTRITVKRMDISKASYVYDYREGEKVYGSPIWSFLATTQTQPATVAMLRDIVDIDFDTDDFDPDLKVETIDTVTHITLSAKSDSMYYYGSLTISFTHPWVVEVTFVATPPAAVQLPIFTGYSVTWWVDGVEVKTPYTLDRGEHTLTFRGDAPPSTTTFSMQTLTPTRVIAIKLGEGDFSGLFSSCTALRQVDNAAIYTYGDNIVLDNLFKSCTNLSIFGRSLFRPGSKLRRCNYLLHSTGITDVTNAFFAGLEVMEDTLKYIFGYTKITQLSSNPFEGMSGIKHVEGLFSNCTTLTTVSVCPLSAFPELLTEKYTFYYCTKLTTVTVDIFSGNPKLTEIAWTFQYARMLPKMAATLNNCPEITTVASMYYGVSALTQIDTSPFENHVKLEKCTSCFGSTGIRSVDVDLFYGCSKLTDVSGTFQSCTSLEYVNPTLFTGVEALNTIDNLFYNCTSLMLPTTLLLDQHRLYSADYAFSNMKGGVFDGTFFNSTSLYRINHCFHKTPITDVPGDLLSGSNVLGYMDYAFSETALEVVPSGLFKTVRFTSINAVGAFKDCKLLRAVEPNAVTLYGIVYPHDMFSGCTSLTTLADQAISLTGTIYDISKLFYGASNLVLDTATIADKLTIKSNYKVDINISSMFEGCSKLTGTMEELYKTYFSEYTFDDSTPAKIAYYLNFIEKCFKLSDYTEYKYPWWTTPKTISVISDETLDVFTLGDMNPVGESGHIPLFSTYYRDVPTILIDDFTRYEDDVTLIAIDKPMRATLEVLFQYMGLMLPDVERVTMRVIQPDEESPPEWVRPTDGSTVIMVFDRGFAEGEGVTHQYGTDVYIFTGVYGGGDYHVE